jgi:hypothetical protein
MADTKLSALTELSATPASGDEFYVRDVSEPSAGESKRITYANLVPSQIVTQSVWAQPHAVDGTATLPVEIVGGLGWAGASLGSSSANGGAFMTIPIPTDFTTIVKLVVQVWVDTAGTNNMLYQVLGTAASNNQNRNQHEDSISETTVSLEQHIMKEIDISAAASAIVAGDYLGVGFQHNGAAGGDAVDAVYILGVLLEYT